MKTLYVLIWISYLQLADVFTIRSFHRFPITLYDIRKYPHSRGYYENYLRRLNSLNVTDRNEAILGKGLSEKTKDYLKDLNETYYVVTAFSEFLYKIYLTLTKTTRMVKNKKKFRMKAIPKRSP